MPPAHTHTHLYIYISQISSICPLITLSQMSSSTVICKISEDVKNKLKEFRFRKSKVNSALIRTCLVHHFAPEITSNIIACLIVRISRENFEVVQEEFLENISIEDLADELPDNSPRYVVFSYEYKQDDGRISYPLIFIYWSPVSKYLKAI